MGRSVQRERGVYGAPRSTCSNQGHPDPHLITTQTQIGLINERTGNPSTRETGTSEREKWEPREAGTSQEEKREPVNKRCGNQSTRTSQQEKREPVSKRPVNTRTRVQFEKKSGSQSTTGEWLQSLPTARAIIIVHAICMCVKFSSLAE